MRAGRDLASVLAARHAALRAHIAAARRGTVVGVHQARVATRRLREAVPVAAVHLRGVRRRRLLRALRDMTRALGEVRECDVALGMLHELASSAPSTLDRVIRRWRRDLQARRREARVELLSACAADRVGWVHLHLDALVAARAATDDDAWRTSLSSQLDTRAQRLRAAIEHAGPLFVVTPLHEVRIAAKRLRYLVELVGECGLAPVQARLTRLKKAQDVLGRLHDLDVLLTHVHALAADEDVTAPEAAALDVIALALERECRQCHATYLRRRSALAQLTDEIRDVIAPRVALPSVPDPSARTADDAR
jgi:CHAD domain-containing protein